MDKRTAEEVISGSVVTMSRQSRLTGTYKLRTLISLTCRTFGPQPTTKPATPSSTTTSGGAQGRPRLSPTSTGGAWGVAHYEEWWTRLGPDPADDELHAAIEPEIISAFAGFEAELHADPNADPAGARADHELARELAEHLDLSDDELEEFRNRARAYVAERLDAVERVARALMDRKNLGEVDVRCVIEGAPFTVREADGTNWRYAGHLSEEALRELRDGQTS